MKPSLPQLDTSVLKQAFILTLVYFLLFDTSILLYKYDHYKAGKELAYAELFKESCYVFLMIFAGFAGFSINNILLKIYAFFLYASGALVSYYIYALKIIPNKQIVKAFFDVESVEAYEHVSIKLIAWIMITCSICIYILRKYNSKDPAGRFSKFLCFVLLFCSIANIATPFYRVFTSHLPINYLHNSYEYFLNKFTDHDKSDITNKYSFKTKAPDDLIAVLIIGESARSDHFSLNGYNRSTNPLLSKIHNLNSYECVASANATYLSVSSMLSRFPASHIEDSLKESSALSIFTKLGFHTSWIATQSLVKYFRDYDFNLYDEVNSALVPGGSALYALSSYDGMMLPYFESEIANKGKSLIVLHTSGSHWNYTARYPQSFNKFTPSCENSSGKRDHSSYTTDELINSYDNSILYTDYFISEVIERLRDKNAFVIYVSDHGESLGEDGFYGHGGEVRPEQMKVPLVVWFSDKFMQHKSLNIDVTKHLSHDNIFHSLLNCSDVSSDVVDSKMSLCK